MDGPPIEVGKTKNRTAEALRQSWDDSSPAICAPLCILLQRKGFNLSKTRCVYLTQPNHKDVYITLK